MATAQLNVVRGTNSKPAATDALVEDLLSSELRGELFVGYPVMASPEGRYAIDALLVSPDVGLVSFDLVEGTELGKYSERQDDAFNKLRARLLTHRDLVRNRDLLVPINTVTYAPALADGPQDPQTPVLTRSTLVAGLETLEWRKADDASFTRALSAIQSISSIRRPASAREPSLPDSRAAKLHAVEESISTLDRLQSKAVIETVEGVQRIRGLAGSGKTIVLALKAAYLHSQHPDWRIAVTFNTRSLKAHFTRLINNFCIEQTSEEPNWERLRVVNSWGAPGGPERDGIYHEFCMSHGVEYMDFNSARRRFTLQNAFNGVVSEALQAVSSIQPLYDAILVDEAQDFAPPFLQMCYGLLHEPKRLVYAYDELQNLTNIGLPSAEEIFGQDEQGEPLVSLSSTSVSEGTRDIILEKCYRNSRPVLVTAHSLGFGIYRPPPAEGRSGIVQMFAQAELWTDIGYRVKSGRLALGEEICLVRTPDTSPRFLEAHSPIDDLLHFQVFEDEESQAGWVAASIGADLKDGELKHQDIVIIGTNPISARRKLGPVRRALLDMGIASHLAGVDTSPEVFYRMESVTCTGIHRAKGNEAAMVYVINAEECHSSAANLASVRNRLFTAITRSKAWVRVVGVGAGMSALADEYATVRQSDFELRFRYPTKTELDQLTIIHRDISDAEQRELEERRAALSSLVQDLKEGRIFAEDLNESDLSALREILGDR